MKKYLVTSVAIALLTIAPTFASASTLGDIISSMETLVSHLQILQGSQTAAVAATSVAALPSGGVSITQSDIGGQSVCNDNTNNTSCLVIRDWPDPVAPIITDNVKGTVVSWNNVPEIWNTIAKNYDSAVFTGQADAHAHEPFIWATTAKNYGYPEAMPGFGVYSYYGYDDNAGGDYLLEGVTTLSALVGGTLAGIDYSNKTVTGNGSATNLINLAKKYYANSGGANVFLDHMSSPTYSSANIGSQQFWYDIAPNIFACQLGSLYKSPVTGSDPGDPSNPSLMSLCLGSVSTWNDVADALKAPGSQIPEFAYTAAQLVAGNLQGTTTSVAMNRFEPVQTCPLNPSAFYWSPSANPQAHFSFNSSVPFQCMYYNGSTQYQSDAAAGIGYLDMLAYEHTSDATYLAHAKSALGFLDAIQYNPDYENLLPYGAIAGARMNAEDGTNFNVHKYLNWIFSDSDVRYFWDMANGSWGGYPVYGLETNPKYSAAFSSKTGLLRGYASAQDTFSAIQSLAPIARYQPQFAQALGKYVTHTATDALLFYPQYAPHQDPTTAAYIASSGTGFSTLLKNSIPYEALLGGLGARDCNGSEPCAGGDALTYGSQYHTNLAIYGGSAGPLAALLHATNVQGIYQVDLLATDIPKPNAYPTYLFYNPLPQTQSVTVNIGIARTADSRLGVGQVMLYDLVSKQIVAQNISSSIAIISLAHDQAAVLTVVPEKAVLQVNNNKLVGNGIVIDYYFNHAPQSSVQPALCTLGGITLASGQASTFYLSTSANNCTAISQIRICNNGTFSGSASYANASCISTGAANTPLPTTSITTDNTSIAVGQSTTIHATFTPGSGDTLTTDAINQPYGTTVVGGGAVWGTPLVNPLTYTFMPKEAGTYTFYTFVQTKSYPSWYAVTPEQVTVNVSATSTHATCPTGQHMMNTVCVPNASPFALPTTRTEFFTDLYQCILGRTPDAGGLSSWMHAASSTTLGSIYQRWFTSPEYLSHKTSNQTFMTQIYNCILFRQPDQNGYNSWLQGLQNGTTRTAVVQASVTSSEFLTGQGPKLRIVTGFSLATTSVSLGNLTQLASVATALQSILDSLKLILPR